MFLLTRTKKIIIASVIAIAVLTPTIYAGASYYQSNELVKEADQLAEEGKFSDSSDRYARAIKKWKWQKGRLSQKIDDVNKLVVESKNFEDGQTSFGNGEWQKCMEYLGQVTPKFPKYGEVQERYSDCEKKLTEAQQAAAAAAQQANNPVSSNSAASTKRNTSSSSSASNSGTSSASNNAGTNSGNNEGNESSEPQTRPVLYLPFNFSLLPDSIMPMGETINHPKPQNPNGHPGIDFQWTNPESIPEIRSSMAGTVTAIKANEHWAGAFDVATSNGAGYGVDYTELGGVKEGLKVGDTVNVGDLIGYPQHPSGITDQPNYRMIHWQFGYVSENTDNTFVMTRLCPMSYFESGAKSQIESLWAATNWPEMKANAPDICSNDYAE